MIKIECIPKNWKLVKVSEVGDLIRGINYKKEDATNSDKGNFVPILRANNINGDLNYDDLVYVPRKYIRDEQLLKVHDILFAMSSGSKHLVGKSAKLTSSFSGSFGAFCAVFRPNAKVNRNYIAYYFQGPYYKQLISEISKGTNINNLKREHILNLNLPLPPDYEQQQIVEKIEELFSELDAGRRQLEAVKKQLETYRQSVLHQAFTGRLVGTGRDLSDGSILSSAATSLNENNFSQLPEGWKWVKISDAGRIETGTTPSKKNLEFYSNDYPFYKPTDLEANYNVRYSIDSLSEKGISKARYLPENSILVTCIGATIGKSGIIRKAGAFNQQINAIVPNDQFDPNYIYYQVISPKFQKSIKENASSTTLPILNKSKFMDLPLAYCPLLEQRQIVQEIESRLSVCNKLEETIETCLQQSEALKQSILKQAFEGKLVKPQTD